MTQIGEGFSGANAPVRFVFGVHLHQPVGNFDHVFRDHANDVYGPLVDQLARRHSGRAMLHISGPLLEWLETHDTPLLDRIGRLATDGKLEFLLAGMYEPILAAIPRADRVEQVVWLREALQARFGVAGDGLWLTERVWEPDLAGDLAAAGVKYVLVDDRHFLVTGFERDQLHVPYRTESNGGAVSVLAIDERLRYLIPFRPAEEIEGYLRELHRTGRPLTVFADDGEKFGGWPGTRDWVYARGWFDRFHDLLDRLQDQGIIQLTGGREAIDAVPGGGLAYLQTSSYREMETWALPPAAAIRISTLEHQLGSARMAGPDGALVRGSHWRNFLVKYSESNRMHKKMAALSGLCRRAGDPVDARRAIGRAQCNDAFWHGVFGGLYLPHLRAAVWNQLAIAEGALRRGQPLLAERLDIDADGADEIWIHSAHFSAIVAPARGGSLVELTRFHAGVNHADVLTRRLEAYHVPPAHGNDPAHTPHEGTPSIHEMEASLLLEQQPPVDLDDRALGVARVIDGTLRADAYAAAGYPTLANWARTRCTVTVHVLDDEAVVRCDARGYCVEWRFSADGLVEAEFTWNAAWCPKDSRFAPEFSVAHDLVVEAPGALETWRHAIETVAKSERGVERVRQGEAVIPLFDARRGEAHVTLRPRGVA